MMHSDMIKDAYESGESLTEDGSGFQFTVYTSGGHVFTWAPDDTYRDASTRGFLCDSSTGLFITFASVEAIAVGEVR